MNPFFCPPSKTIRIHLVSMDVIGSGGHGTSKAMNVGQNFSQIAALWPAVTSIYKERLDDSEELKNAGYAEIEIDCTN